MQTAREAVRGTYGGIEMTLVPFQGRCEHCGHDHSSDWFFEGYASASAAPAEGREAVDERAAFEREHDRYVVLKRKDLSYIQWHALQTIIDTHDMPTRQCVVVEEDWPEYEPVWAMIEARMTGRAALATPPTMSEGVGEPAWYVREVHSGCPEFNKVDEFRDGCGGGQPLYTHTASEPISNAVRNALKEAADSLTYSTDQADCHLVKRLRAIIERAGAKGGGDGC